MRKTKLKLTKEKRKVIGEETAWTKRESHITATTLNKIAWVTYELQPSIRFPSSLTAQSAVSKKKIIRGQR